MNESRELPSPVRDNSNSSPANEWSEIGLDSQTLGKLCAMLHDNDKLVRANAQRLLYEATKRLAMSHVRRFRSPEFRLEQSTDFLANAIEKSFLSYMGKDKFRGQELQDTSVKAILWRMAKWIVIRELRPLMNDRLRSMIERITDQLSGAEMPPDASLAEKDFRDFLGEVVLEMGEGAMGVFEALLKGQPPAEAQRELNLSRSTYFRYQRKVRQACLVHWLESEIPGAKAVCQDLEAGKRPRQIAAERNLTLERVERIANTYHEYLKSDDESDSADLLSSGP